MGALGDQIIREAEERKRRAASAPAPSASSPSSSASSPSSSAKPRPLAAVERYWPYALAGAAMFYPGTRKRAGEALERIPGAKGSSEELSKFGRGVAKTFAPESLSNYGADVAPLDRAKVGRTLKGGKKGSTPLAPETPQTGGAFAQEGAAVLRKSGATAARSADQMRAKINPERDWGDIFSGKNKSGQALTAGWDMPVTQEFLRQHENRSKGMPMNSEWVPISNAIRKTTEQMQRDMMALEKIRTQGLPEKEADAVRQQLQDSFNRDYIHHVYDKVSADRLTADWTKKRKYMTYEDAAAEKGYLPRYTDPFELLGHQVNAFQRTMHKGRAWSQLEAEGHVRYYRNPDAVPKGWAGIEGRYGERRIGAKGAVFDRAYMPETVANLWNKAFPERSTGWAGSAAEQAMKLSNDMKAFKLGLSGYHGVTTAIHSIQHEMVRALLAVKEGQPLRAAQIFITSPAAPVRPFFKAKRLRHEWLDDSKDTRWLRENFDASTNPHAKLSAYTGSRGALVAHLGEMAGIRALPYKPAIEAQFHGSGSFFDTIAKGSYRAEMIAGMREVRNNPLKGFAAPLKLAGRMAETLSDPILKRYVPMIKNAAFDGRMSDWVIAHPNASIREAEAAARKISDFGDNLFGEMVQDNLFYSKPLKLGMQAALVSWSYALGTARNLVGGAGELARGNLTERAAYTIVMLPTMAFISGMYQWLKAGIPPNQMTLRDVFAPRTGGIDAPTGQPERANPMSDLKEVDHVLWQGEPMAAIEGKESPMLRLILDFATNQGWQGHPIHPEFGEPSMADNFMAYAQHAINAITPIPFETNVNPEGNISAVERFMGIRAAGQSETDPERAKAAKEAHGKREWDKKLHADQKQRNLYNTLPWYGARGIGDH